MKKLISFCVGFLLAMSVFADEGKLFDASVKAELNGFDWVENFEITSDSGAFTKKDLRILPPNEQGLRFAAINPPADKSCNYKVLTAYPSFLNEGVVGGGVIENTGSIKSIKVIYTTNRPYDEVFLMYSTSAKETAEIKYVKIPSDFNAVKSMEEKEFVFDNPNYEPDVKKREILNNPVVGDDSDGIYLRGFKIQTNAASGYNTYSPYSIFYLKEVSVIYDKAKDDEKIEFRKKIESEFGFNSNKEGIKQRAIQKIEERERIRAGMEALKAKEPTQQADAK